MCLDAKIKEFSPATLSMGRLAASLLQFGQNGTAAGLDRFLSCLMAAEHPEATAGLFRLCQGLICTWAGLENLSRPDAAEIEAARKICDVMGWPPIAR